MKIRLDFKWALAALLAASLALRLVLVLRGGQFFWGDENRYLAAEDAWKSWESGAGAREALRAVLGGADHLGFKVLMLVPAWIQRHTGGSYLVPAITVSLFSVGNIFWVWRIARRAGGGEREAFWAAAAMAAANGMFYWARHLMPYDVALCWALACLYGAVHPAPRFRHSLLAGVLGCVAFVTYNGYWVFVACALTGHVALSRWTWRDILSRGAGGLTGLLGSFALLVGLDQMVLNVNLPESYAGFASTINQGDFREGALVFFDYLWRTEHLTAVLWAVAMLGVGWLLRGADRVAQRRGMLWAGGVVGTAAILIVGSNFLEKFVVYGRLVRQVEPFCALLVGWAAVRFFRPEGRAARLQGVAFAGMLVSGAWNMSVPLRQEFPVPFSRRALAYLAVYRRAHPEVTVEKIKYLYWGFIWPYADRTVPPPHEVLLESPHPLAWRPYLYEGFNRAQRDQIEATDIRMRLIRLKD